MLCIKPMIIHSNTEYIYYVCVSNNQKCVRIIMKKQDPVEINRVIRKTSKRIVSRINNDKMPS